MGATILLDEVVEKVLVSCCTLGKRHQEIEEDRR
jgi:hypothetical protein